MLLLLGLAVLNESLVREPQQSSLGLQAAALRNAEQIGRNIEVVQAMGMEDDLVRRWSLWSDRSADQQYLAGARSAMSRSLACVSGLPEPTGTCFPV